MNRYLQPFAQIEYLLVTMFSINFQYSLLKAYIVPVFMPQKVILVVNVFKSVQNKRHLFFNSANDCVLHLKYNYEVTPLGRKHFEELER